MSRIAPLLPPNVDLTDFKFMSLDVRRLRDSRIASVITGDEFKAAIMLWCASWHQIPAGSLPDDDIELTTLAGFGRVMREWQKVKQGALYGWIKCMDGRLWHPVVAEKAAIAWHEKRLHAWSKECERIRKDNKRRAENKLDALPTPERPERIDSLLPAENDDIPAEGGRISNGKTAEQGGASGGIPPENPLNRMDREGDREKKDSDLRSGAASAPPDARSVLWSSGLATLIRMTGKQPAACRSLLGKWAKQAKDDCSLLNAIISDCVEIRPGDPVAWIASGITSRMTPPDRLAWLHSSTIPEAPSFDLEMTPDVHGTYHAG